MVTLSLLQIPSSEAFKEIINLHLTAPESEKKKQLLENLKPKKVVLYPKINKCSLFF